MKTAIIGAGISGLSIARILQSEHEVTIYEKGSTPGGLCRCKMEQGALFHLTGGHCFNSRRTDVLDWFWTQKDNFQEDFIKVPRLAVVSLRNGNIVHYPIENHIYQMPASLQEQVISDLLKLDQSKASSADNFADFLRFQFGETLYNEYFAPYNEKIWQRSLHDVPTAWLGGKLPMPTVQNILLANINHENEQQMVHSTFYASKQLGAQHIINTLAEGLHIQTNVNVDNISRTSQGWIIEGQLYERVIFCGNSRNLPDILHNVNLEAISPLRGLEYHGTTSVLCELEETPYTWVYMPSKLHDSHRIICTGNYYKGNNPAGKATGIIEFSKKLSKAEILNQLSRIPFSPKYLSHHWEECSYPVQDGNTRGLIADAKYTLEPLNFHLLGRFAEWEYYNMDAAMAAAIDLNKKLSLQS